MATVKVLLKMNKKNEQGFAPLYLRIIKDRKTKFVSIGIRLKPEHWNEDDGKVRKSHPNAGRFNAAISQKIAEAEGLAVEMETKSKSVNAYKIKEKLLGKASTDFFVFADKHIDKLEKTRNYSTYKKAKSVVKKLKTFMNERPLFFDEITVKLLKDYEAYLASEKSNRVNTVHANMKIIRRILNEAMNEDLMPRTENPFLRYKLKTEATQRAYLTEDELLKIENLSIKEDLMMFHHRNIYVFAAYTGGLRVSDILQLKWANFDGEKLNIKIQKTGIPLSILLPGKALDIIKHYNNLHINNTKRKKVNPESFIFPLLKVNESETDPRIIHNAISSATAYINKDLKTITKKAKIAKHISFHTSRHTWATRALRKGMRIEYVSKLMGHSAIKETQIYTKIVNQELDNAMTIFND